MKNRDPEMFAEVIKDEDGYITWATNEEDSGDSDSFMPVLELRADTFPIGTKVEIHTFEREEKPLTPIEND